MMQVPLT